MGARDYQLESIDQIRNFFMQGITKVLLWLSTGAGKTWIFCLMTKEAVKRGNRVIILVRGRKLVDQASQRLFREQVSHGVLMSGHWNYRPHAQVQVCSIDTLKSRKLFPDASLVIIDEAHLFTSKADIEYLKNYSEKPGVFMIPVTATPYCKKGLRHVADKIVHPVTMLDLIDRGFLVPFRYYAPTSPDLTGVKVSSTGDYVNEQVEEAMVEGQLTGKIVQHWEELSERRPTLVFACNIRHSKTLAKKFNDNGHRFVHCDADCSDKERDEAIRQLEAGEIDGICNVGIFCTGVDIPSLGCLVGARPTKSKNLFIQMAGRGTRLADGKNDCIYLDHAGNIEEHGLPTDETPVDLDGTKKNPVKKSKICKSCFAVFRASYCPECGAPAPVERGDADLEESDKKLVELKNVELDPIKREYEKLKRHAKEKKYNYKWANYKLIDKFGYDNVKDYLQPSFVESYERRNDMKPVPKLFQDSPFSRRY